jgi:hypothetical protein
MHVCPPFPFYHPIFTLTSGVDYDRDPYEESYDPEPYAPAPLDPHFYPNGNQFPPPPVDSTMNGTPAPYNPADYPPPPGAAPPPQPYYGAGPGPEQYHRRADDNVRNPFPDSGC